MRMTTTKRNFVSFALLAMLLSTLCVSIEAKAVSDEKVLEAVQSISRELTWEKASKKVSSSKLLCSLCEKVSDFSVHFVESDTFEHFLEGIIDAICPIVAHYNHPECRGVISAMGPFLLGSLSQRFMSKDELCGYELKVCDAPARVEDTLEDFTKAVMADKPATEPRSYKKSGDSLKIAHVSDIHVSLLYTIGGNKNCTFNVCCIPDSGEPATPEDAAPKWGTFNCDIPLLVPEKMTEYINNVVKPDILLWTGDNPEHDIWMQSVSSNVKSSEVLAKMLQDGLDPSIKVIPALGNHEQFPVDQFSLDGTNSREVLVGNADAYKSWLSESAFESFKTSGNFVETLEDLNIDVIVFNTQEACDLDNWYLLSDYEEQQKVLNFLLTSLEASEKSGRKAFLIGHIPPGVGQCVRKWTERYNVLADRFQNTIRGQFYGHTHRDHFHATRNGADNVANGIIWITPEAGSYNKYPSFRVFEFDKKAREVVDYEKFWFNFTLANEIDDSTWTSNYVFLEEYGLPDASPASLEQLGNHVIADEDFAKMYNRNRLTYGWDSELDTCDELCRKKLGCPILYDNFPQQNACMGKKGDYANTGAKILDWLQGPWYKPAGSDSPVLEQREGGNRSQTSETDANTFVRSK